MQFRSAELLVERYPALTKSARFMARAEATAPRSEIFGRSTLQEGYDSAGASFAEVGVSTPGASLTGYYVWGELFSCLVQLLK